MRLQSAKLRGAVAACARPAMHRVLTPADYRATAWRNGGGRTTELAVHPQGANFAQFAWRVSIADVTQDGPFSTFAGVDRTLVLLRGAGMRLEGADATLDVRAPYDPISFAGDVAFGCMLHDGPVKDFNLMVRRSAARGDIDIVRGEAGTARPACFRVCYAAAGPCECLLPGQPPLRLNEHDTLVVDAQGVPSPSLHVNPLSPATVAVVVAIDMTGRPT